MLMVRIPIEHKDPSIYFTALWLQTFNPELNFERLDLVEEYIRSAYLNFLDSKYDNVLKSEIECIESYLSNQKSKKVTYIFSD